jgi:TolB-like protein/Flp pilus assembly protein TadD/tRNA A-37 threonylcarbamoyl transferase component Bud32
MADIFDRLKNSLADRYALERELGAGGMATVYLAEDLKHHRKVAVKVLRPELAAALGADRFHQEIEIAAQLTHPHILPLHDSGEVDGFLYYVMPYIEGESLREKLAKEGELPISDAVRILKEVVDALAEAHSHGVVHRDIKPDNVMLRGRHALVTDFGVAKAVNEATGRQKLTTEGIALGTPAYMAPEQAAADPQIDHRADIYAVGAVAYELLTGRPPFTGNTQQEILAAHVTQAPEPVTKYRQSVPPALADLVMKCLEKKPADRWQTAEELIPQLEALATPSGGVTPTSSQPKQAATPRLVGRRMALGMGAVALAVVVGTLLWPKADGVGSAEASMDRTAIAVLPFENLSADESRAYLASGLHDELLTQLFKVAALKVIGRTSVLGYAGTTKPLNQIADELGVGSIVEGSAQVEGNRLRVNVQLIDATTGEALWAERYERTLDDVFATQSEIAEHIVSAVGVTLTDAEASAIAMVPTDNAEAYRLYLQGEQYYQLPSRLPRNMEIAEQLYERALELDPEFALAYVSLSFVHSTMYVLAYDPYPSRHESQRVAAEAALRLAPELPQARAAMGDVYYSQRDYTKALEEYTVATEALPGSAEMWLGRGYVYRRLGEWDQALAAFEKATALDPRDAEILQDLGGLTLRFLHRYEEAASVLNRALELAPDLATAQLNKAITYLRWRGELDTLRSLLDRGPETFAEEGSRDHWRVRLAFWERNPNVILALLGEPERVTFKAQQDFEPGLLYAAWAFRLRGEETAATRAFTGALVQLDSAIRELPDDWRVHVSRGLVLASLGRVSEARLEAVWLRESPAYTDQLFRVVLSEARAMIFAQAGLVDEALSELEPLLAGPSHTSVHMIRLDPRWDPIREHPRFQALLEQYGN